MDFPDQSIFPFSVDTDWASYNLTQFWCDSPAVRVISQRLRAQSHKASPPPPLPPPQYQLQIPSLSPVLLTGYILEAPTPLLRFNNLIEQLTELRKVYLLDCQFCFLDKSIQLRNSQMKKMPRARCVGRGEELRCLLQAHHPSSISTCLPIPEAFWTLSVRGLYGGFIMKAWSNHWPSGTDSTSSAFPCYRGQSCNWNLQPSKHLVHSPDDKALSWSFLGAPSHLISIQTGNYHFGDSKGFITLEIHAGKGVCVCVCIESKIFFIRAHHVLRALREVPGEPWW